MVRVADGYAVFGKRHDLQSQSRRLKCNLCGGEFEFRSNLAICEETRRVSAYLVTPDPCCPTEGCANRMRGALSHPGLYYAHGRTAAGSRRWRCRACRATVSARKPGRAQRRSHENLTVFRALVNKTPLRGIARIADLSPQTVIDKLDQIHRCCVAFAADRERRLPDLAIDRLWLATDRQDYVINWSARTDRRNTQLTAVATADNRSGYVFGQHLNYDPSVQTEQIEALSKAAGDDDGRDPAFRRYARLWLPRDWRAAAASNMPEKPLADETPGVHGRIVSALHRAESAPDAEAMDHIDRLRALPKRGMQVHVEYTVAGHFQLLLRLVGHAGKLRFFMDQDETLRFGCLAAFSKHVEAGRADAFFVQIDKGLTVDARKRLVSDGQKRLEFVREELGQPDWSDKQVRRHIIEQAVLKMDRSDAKLAWRKRWVLLPHRALYEPEKAACLMTDRRGMAPSHLAAVMDRASLHGIDRFFMQLRRMLSPLERPISTASNQGRVWRGYSPYDPGRVQQLIDIYRVFYNFAKPGERRKDADGNSMPGQTPAMRLGLAKGLVRIEDILYFGR